MSGLSIETKQLISKFKELQGKEKDKIIRDSVSKALEVVKQETIKQISAKGLPANKPNKIYGFTLADGVTKEVYKDGSGGSVAIMKNYLLRFLEKDTAERQYTTKNGKEHRTGKISGRHFFRDARNMSEDIALKVLNENLEKGIKKIWDKKN